MNSSTLFSSIASIIGCEEDDYFEVRRTTGGETTLSPLHHLPSKVLFEISDLVTLGKKRQEICLVVRELLGKILERIIKKELESESELSISLSPERIYLWEKDSTPEKLNLLHERLKKRLNGSYRKDMTYSWIEISEKIKHVPFLMNDKGIRECLAVVDKAYNKMKTAS